MNNYDVFKSVNSHSPSHFADKVYFSENGNYTSGELATYTQKLSFGFSTRFKVFLAKAGAALGFISTTKRDSIIGQAVNAIAKVIIQQFKNEFNVRDNLSISSPISILEPGEQGADAMDRLPEDIVGAYLAQKEFKQQQAIKEQATREALPDLHELLSRKGAPSLKPVVSAPLPPQIIGKDLPFPEFPTN